MLCISGMYRGIVIGMKYPVLGLVNMLLGLSLEDEQLCTQSVETPIFGKYTVWDHCWNISKCAFTLYWKSFLWKVYCLDHHCKMRKCVSTLCWNSCLWQVYCWNHYGFMSKANVHLLSVGNHFSGKCTVWIITGR